MKGKRKCFLQTNNRIDKIKDQFCKYHFEILESNRLRDLKGQMIHTPTIIINAG